MLWEKETMLVKSVFTVRIVEFGILWWRVERNMGCVVYLKRKKLFCKDFDLEVCEEFKNFACLTLYQTTKF